MFGVLKFSSLGGRDSLLGGHQEPCPSPTAGLKGPSVGGGAPARGVNPGLCVEGQTGESPGAAVGLQEAVPAVGLTPVIPHPD